MGAWSRRAGDSRAGLPALRQVRMRVSIASKKATVWRRSRNFPAVVVVSRGHRRCVARSIVAVVGAHWSVVRWLVVVHHVPFLGGGAWDGIASVGGCHRCRSGVGVGILFRLLVVGHTVNEVRQPLHGGREHIEFFITAFRNFVDGPHNLL